MARPRNESEWITYEPWVSDPKDVIWPPSSCPTVEQDDHARNQRVELLLNQYAKDSRPFILSASLRGPFDGRWRNPWKTQIPTSHSGHEISTSSGIDQTRHRSISGGNNRKSPIDVRRISSTRSPRPSSRDQRLQALSPWFKIASPQRSHTSVTSKTSSLPPRPSQLRVKTPPQAIPTNTKLLKEQATTFAGQEVTQPKSGIHRPRISAAVPERVQDAAIVHYSSPPPSPTGMRGESTQLTGTAASVLMTPNASIHSDQDSEAVKERSLVGFRALNSPSSPEPKPNRETANDDRETGPEKEHYSQAVGAPPDAVSRFDQQAPIVQHFRDNGIVSTATSAADQLPKANHSASVASASQYSTLPSVSAKETHQRALLDRKHKTTMSKIWPDGIAEAEWELSQQAMELREGPCSQVRRVLSPEEYQEQIDRVQSLSARDSQGLSQRGAEMPPERARLSLPKTTPPTKSSRKMAREKTARPEQALDGTSDTKEWAAVNVAETIKRPRLMDFNSPRIGMDELQTCVDQSIGFDSPMPSTQSAMLSALDSFKAGLLAPAGVSDERSEIRPFEKQSARHSLQSANTQALFDEAPVFSEGDLHTIKQGRTPSQPGRGSSQLTQLMGQVDAMLDIWDVDSALATSR